MSNIPSNSTISVAIVPYFIPYVIHEYTMVPSY